jgi:hypothetical protein
MDEHGGHQHLHGSGHRSVTPYDHGRMRVVLLCVCCSRRELNLPDLGLRALV